MNGEFGQIILHECLFVGNTAPGKLEKRLIIANTVFESYNKIISLSADEKQAITYFFVYIGVMLSAWFAKCGQITLANSCVQGTQWIFENKQLFVFC